MVWCCIAYTDLSQQPQWKKLSKIHFIGWIDLFYIFSGIVCGLVNGVCGLKLLPLWGSWHGTLRNPKCHWQKERGKTQKTLQDTARGSAVVQGSRVRGWNRWGCCVPGPTCPCRGAPGTPERKEKKNHKHNRACNHWPHMNITKTSNEVRLNGRCPQPYSDVETQGGLEGRNPEVFLTYQVEKPKSTAGSQFLRRAFLHPWWNTSTGKLSAPCRWCFGPEWFSTSRPEPECLGLFGCFFTQLHQRELGKAVALLI